MTERKHRLYCRFLALLSGLFLLSIPAAAAQTISSPAANPSSVSLNTPTAVTITAQISDPSLIENSVNLQRYDPTARVFNVVSEMYDDGTHGDAVAGDGIFTVKLTFDESAPFPVVLRVSAAFKGSLTRVFSSPFNLTVTGGVPAAIAITSPANLSFINTSPVTVSGTVSESKTSVKVNGVTAPVSGTGFTVSIPLLEGPNTVTAVATNSQGITTTSSVQITLDTTPPRVTIDSPFDGYITAQSSITVTGKVNDIVVGTVNSAQAHVTINGVSAQVANRSFVAANVPLSNGNNTITATATDRAGNAATASINVTRIPPTQPHITVVSGNNQTGVVNAQLAQPLVVQLLDGMGAPMSSQTVVFAITENDGLINGSATPKSVLTNSQGEAQVTWTLGSRAGANNLVQATAAGVAGSALFTASGLGGTPTKIVVDAGGQQTGATGQPLPNPLVVVVTDNAHNRLANVPVTFQVTAGGGNFAGQQSLITNTDGDGRALALLTLGPTDGIANNLVLATFSGNPGFPAAFSLSGQTPGNPAATAIKGVVLDNSNNPVPGATIRAYLQNVPAQVSGGLPPAATATSDLQGQFFIAPAPVGFVKLLVDGSTIQRPGKWPNLEYELVTVAGQTNTLGMPVYLLPIDTQDQICVSETAGGKLTLPQVPGFALTVQAGSATFPGGSKTGCISVTPVHPDKIPMVPGFGQQPRFIVTIQPAGTMFNPPAQITIPNSDALKPNQITEMYGFDHDLGMFVSIGTGTASADGTTISSDRGVGVVKAGWFCGGPPADAGGAGNCPECQKCNGVECVTDPAKENKNCTIADGTGCGICQDGQCTPITITFQTQAGAVLPSPAKVPVFASSTKPQHFQVVVTPDSEVGNVTVDTSAGIGIVGSITTAGNIIKFDVIGITQSTARGDNSIIAKDKCGLTVTQPVTAVVPAKVATPHDTGGTGPVTGHNADLNATTSPAILGLPAGDVALATEYIKVLTITVHDQFDDPLGDLYTGAPVTELANVPINQALSATGTYSDPVGVIINGGIAPAGSPAAVAWPSQGPLPLKSFTQTQNIAVQVDGFPLNPAIQNRVVTATPPNTVTITWP